ncbi:hypothetical protein BS50DRAFT_638655 [Corynespora cassiicola Philippines]|uniref:Uncharacterized protein n=1 Tax=Corynespora cassiicola Philippines TaxID=1448308 RepID=A0A2T2N9G4_CORCC|nr:hypothetical protein BS50DRAFT_638655 [Corynespora cassiicola Philippines]
MAEQITHDVVKEAQSMGGPSPIDDTATSTSNTAGDGGAPSGPTNAKPTTSEAHSTSTNATNATTTQADSVQAPGKDGADTASTGTESAKESKEQIVNGDSGEQSASESLQAVGDASGGSDTDISRPGSVDQSKRAGGHLRSNSVKRPASFKSVSVTKNFLAKSAVSTPPARAGEKAAPTGQPAVSTQQTGKARLVAKSGSGIGNVSRSLSKMNGTTSGPDASKVWNKNQPVPPAPPKQFTDEELKQQYGIHLATRLQADEAGKEAKWADIDDDEDDWAPDTVQWMDGTKSTVAAVENQPPPPEEPKPAPKKETPPEPPKPTPTPPTTSQRLSSTGGTKTILKPGASLSGSTKPSLSAKGQSDKPTLVAKPSTGAPVKSPWATLPPVEKVSPIQANPPSQQPPRLLQGDARGYDSMPPPAKEIAPDDFNRSWRDDRGNRELFNSHNGRYEPVNDMRRGSFRDSYRHQPSVLQRPHDGPAEPSAAFQTSRTSAEGPSWGRRRNSSNVSGGSGRRMSIDRRAPDLPHPSMMQRRESHSVNGLDAPAPDAPRQPFAHGQNVPDRLPLAQSASPSLSNAQPLSPYGSVASTGNQDPAIQDMPIETAAEMQQRLMREKIERAKRAHQERMEAEKKAEEEKRERLRKKMEELAPPKTEEKPAAEQSPQKDKAVPVPIKSPPKPPVPTSEGEVAQYGVMKVHQPHPVKKPYHHDSAAGARSVKAAESLSKTNASPSNAPAEAQPKLPTSPPTFTRDSERNKSQPEQTQGPTQQSEAAATQGTKPSSASQGPWSSSLPQSRPWASNVWGPPQAKDRALGNGTFDASYRGQPPSVGPQQLPPQPQSAQTAPIGSLKPSSSQPPVTPSQPFAQQTIYSQATTMPTQTNAALKPGPIAPPADKGWGNFHANIRRDDQDLAVKSRQELERLGEGFRPEIREKYTDQQGKSQSTLHNKVIDESVKSKLAQTLPTTDLKVKDEASKQAGEGTPPQAIGQGTHLQSAGQGARSSRFFPRPSDTTPQSSPASKQTDSPPPPETESHPAFTGDTNRPVVRMPKPSPRVRLPPSEPAVAEAPVSMPPRRFGMGARPLALNPEWQARFNSLLEKSPPAPVPASIAKGYPATPAKPGSLAVAASSKAPLDVRESKTSATVSLPNAVQRVTFANDGSSEVVTRTSAEGVLLEEREFGSLPIVRLSKVPHLAANEPPAGFPPVARPNSKLQRTPLEAMTKPNISFFDHDSRSDNMDVVIRFGSMREAVTRSMPIKRGNGARKGSAFNKSRRNITPNGTPSGQAQGQGQGQGQNQNQNPRARKPSTYGQGSNTNTNRDSRGNGWNSNRSTPPHNNSNNNTWARRAAPAAPVH